MRPDSFVVCDAHQRRAACVQLFGAGLLGGLQEWLDQVYGEATGTTTDEAFMPYAKGKSFMCPKLTGRSLRNCQRSHHVLHDD
jgi:hypothetical protein